MIKFGKLILLVEVIGSKVGQEARSHCEFLAALPSDVRKVSDLPSATGQLRGSALGVEKGIAQRVLTNSSEVTDLPPIRWQSHATPQRTRLRFIAYEASSVASSLISVAPEPACTTSTGTRHASVLMKHVPVLSSRQ